MPRRSALVGAQLLLSSVFVIASATPASAAPPATMAELRAAIDLVNADGADHTITLLNGTTYSITGAACDPAFAEEDDNATGDLDMVADKNVTIETPPGVPATVDISCAADTFSRAIEFLPVGDPDEAHNTLTLRNLRIIGGTVSDGESGGAVLVVQSNVVADAVQFANNRTVAPGDGGALAAVDGNVTASSSTFNGNTAGGNGGGVSVVLGSITTAGSAFADNHAGAGGALAMRNGSSDIGDSVFSANSTLDGIDGVAAACDGDPRRTAGENSGQGGAVFGVATAVTIARSRFVDNHTGDGGDGGDGADGTDESCPGMGGDGGASGGGGAISTVAGDVTLHQVEFSRNHTGHGGAGGAGGAGSAGTGADGGLGGRAGGGGAVDAIVASLSADHSLFAANVAGNGGAGGPGGRGGAGPNGASGGVGGSGGEGGTGGAMRRGRDLRTWALSNVTLDSNSAGNGGSGANGGAGGDGGTAGIGGAAGNGGCGGTGGAVASQADICNPSFSFIGDITLQHVTATENGAGGVGGVAGSPGPNGAGSPPAAAGAVGQPGGSYRTIFAAGSIDLVGTVVGTQANGADGVGCAAATITHAATLDTDGTCSGAAPYTFASFGLSALADHGGLTETRVPGPASTLVDAEPTCTVADDQRGVTRPSGACEIGAVEINNTTVTTDSDGDGTPDNADAFPNDPSEDTDTDGDGVGDNADAFPNDPTRSTSGGGGGGTASPTPTPTASPSPTVSVSPTPAPIPSPSPTQPPATCGGQTVTIQATVGEVTFGTAGQDVIAGTTGNDTIYGRGGNDIICGGDGRDTLFGNRGGDELYGGDGRDVIQAGKGHDTARGKDGADVITGGDGNDQLLGGRRADELAGGSGDDDLDGGLGNDACTGGSGRNSLIRCE